MSVMIALLPFFGDRIVPIQLKILLALVVSVVLFPVLVSSGYVRPADANLWASHVSGIASTVGLEVIFGLILGYIAKIAFDGIAMGANLVGNFMGFASASYYDPHQESQTEIIAQLQNSLAMLIFLSIDGHHFMLKAAVSSYQFVGVGKAVFGPILSQHLISVSAHVFQYGLQLATPVAISLFSVNLIFGIMSKAIPQINIFVLSFTVSALIGFIVLFLSVSEFQEVVVGIFEKSKEWLEVGMMAMAGRR
jgi:flagellar biosynthetic protein FliR